MSSVMMLPLLRSLPIISVVRPSAMKRTTIRKGEMILANISKNGVTVVEKATLLFKAMVFGVISPKSSSMGNMMKMFTHHLSSPPMS